MSSPDNKASSSYFGISKQSGAAGRSSSFERKNSNNMLTIEFVNEEWKEAYAKAQEAQTKVQDLITHLQSKLD